VIALRGLHPALRPYAEAALKIAAANGLSPQVTSVYRSLGEQTQLRANYEKCLANGRFPSDTAYAPGLSCRWPANRPGDSAHNFRFAFDSWVPAEQMPLWRAIREYVGWRVPDNDVIHSELPDWRTYLA
jgi:hypothetical protein